MKPAGQREVEFGDNKSLKDKVSGQAGPESYSASPRIVLF